MDAYEALITRRTAIELGEPAPDLETVRKLLAAAMRAPDHGRLRPWRFLLIEGTAREKLGDLFVSALAQRVPSANVEMLKRERRKPLRAPLLIVVAARLDENPKIPAVEQLLAVGAAAQNIMIASHALGYGAAWKTGDPAYDDNVKQALGLSPSDAIVGFLYIGTPRALPVLPAPLDPADYMLPWPE